MEFTFITPAGLLNMVVTGDSQKTVGLEISEGELLTVVVKDPESKDEFTSKSKLYTPSENEVPDGANPLIRLCPKDFLEFKYF